MDDTIRIHIDGGSRGNPGLSGYGVVVRDATGEIITQLQGSMPSATCNEAEYAGLIAALTYARRQGFTRVQIVSDSALLVNQATGRWKVKATHLRRRLVTVRQLEDEIGVVGYEWIPREMNVLADALATAAMDAAYARERRTVRVG